MRTRSLAVLLLVLSCARIDAARADFPFSLGHELADSVLIVKSERKLYLMKAGQILKAIDVSLGLVPRGAKRREGDFRTPEGRYVLESRKVDSEYFLAIQVSYPNAADRELVGALEREGFVHLAVRDAPDVAVGQLAHADEQRVFDLVRIPPSALEPQRFVQRAAHEPI